MNLRHAAAVGLLSVALAGCSSTPSGPYLCTDIYAYLTAIAVDTAGQPVSGLTIRDSVPRTGAAWDETQQPVLGAGSVVIFSDGDQQRVSRTRTEPVTVSGHGTAGSFSASYVFDATGCHVEKVSGPDSVVVR